MVSPDASGAGDQQAIEWPVDYASLRAQATSPLPNEVIRFLWGELPFAWLDAYMRGTPGRVNVHRIRVGQFEYLFDFQKELLNKGGASFDSDSIEDRVVAVHGQSKVLKRRRSDHLMRDHPLGPIELMEPARRALYDRGHFIGHAAGGELSMNLFPQYAPVNRGWSAPGKIYRAMERYCQVHPMTYCFSRPIYKSNSSLPRLIEFGLLRKDGALWIQQFPNYGKPEDWVEADRRFREQVLNQDSGDQ